MAVAIKCVKAIGNSDLTGNDDNVQGYLSGLWDQEVFTRCRDALSEHADLTQYSTPIAMDDLNEIREALGYETINLRGGSYGSDYDSLHAAVRNESYGSPVSEVNSIGFRVAEVP